MKTRVVLLFASICLLFAMGLVRVFYLQTIPQQNLAKLKKNQYTAKISLLPHRGKILDRNGDELASSISTRSLYADPSIIERPRSTAKQLAKILAVPWPEIYAKISQSEKRFIWIKRLLEPEVVEKVKDLEIYGLGFMEEGKRTYPNQNVAAQVLGFVGSDGGGLEGLEKKYDAELRGEKISIQSRKDARGRPLVVSGQIFETANDGATIESTLDKEIQYELERQLQETFEKQKADRATGIVMDPSTGEVLAMASIPSFDPARPSASLIDNRRNHVVTDLFEPGSTFKIITAAAALRTGRIHPNTKYFCENGKMKIGKHWIHEAETNHKFGWMSLAQIIEVSSNIGSTKVAMDVGENDFRRMIDEFGFGKPTGIDFQGEASGIISKEKWNDHLLSNISFGHGIGVSAMQIANAYSAIGNGGKLMKPFLIKRVVDHQNNTIFENSPQVMRQVLSPKESSTLTMMLSGATQDGGTGTLARVDGYPVAGKTGTAQKVDTENGGYMKKAYVSSFAGFVPAGQPQFMIYIVIDNPKKDMYGAQVAAPVFNRVASFALRKKGFLPVILTENSQRKRAVMSQAAKDILSHARADLQNFGEVPDFKGLTLKEIAARAKANPSLENVEIQYFGSGVAYNQFPEARAPLKEFKKVRVYLK